MAGAQLLGTGRVSCHDLAQRIAAQALRHPCGAGAERCHVNHRCQQIGTS